VSDCSLTTHSNISRARYEIVLAPFYCLTKQKKKGKTICGE